MIWVLLLLLWASVGLVVGGTITNDLWRCANAKQGALLVILHGPAVWIIALLVYIWCVLEDKE